MGQSWALIKQRHLLTHTPDKGISFSTPQETIWPTICFETFLATKVWATDSKSEDLLDCDPKIVLLLVARRTLQTWRWISVEAGRILAWHRHDLWDWTCKYTQINIWLEARMIAVRWFYKSTATFQSILSSFADSGVECSMLEVYSFWLCGFNILSDATRWWIPSCVIDPLKRTMLKSWQCWSGLQSARLLRRTTHQRKSVGWLWDSRAPRATPRWDRTACLQIISEESIPIIEANLGTRRGTHHKRKGPLCFPRAETVGKAEAARVWVIHHACGLAQMTQASQDLKKGSTTVK